MTSNSRYTYDRNSNNKGKVWKGHGTWSAELDDLLALDEGLTDWEVNFVTSVDDMRRWRGYVTTRQAQTIAKVWDRRIGNVP